MARTHPALPALFVVLAAVAMVSAVLIGWGRQGIFDLLLYVSSLFSRPIGGLIVAAALGAALVLMLLMARLRRD